MCNKIQCCIRVILCLGSMHIGSLTALPDQQLVQKNKKTKRLAVKLRKIKCCQVRRVANDSTHCSTSNYYSRHKRATKSPHYSSNLTTRLLQNTLTPTCTFQLIVTFKILCEQRTRERANERIIH